MAASTYLRATQLALKRFVNAPFLAGVEYSNFKNLQGDPSLFCALFVDSCAATSGLERQSQSSDVLVGDGGSKRIPYLHVLDGQARIVDVDGMAGLVLGRASLVP
jgi:hypothetical protein